MQYFKTAQTYFSALIDSFHIFAISEHCLFVEQIELLEASTNYKYKCIAACAEEKPPLLSGKRAHGGVALFWKSTLGDVVTPLEEIDSDRIVGICCDFNDVNPLFILCVYLPSSSHDIEKFNEYLDYLWVLYDSLSIKGFVIVIGDPNGDFGNALGDRGFYEPNNRGLELLDFANYFNLCPTNLLQICRGPLKTFVSHCGRFKPAIDYILLPNCLSDSTVSCKTFEHVIDNTSDHLQITLEINYSLNKNTALFSENSSETSFKNKIRWSKFSFEEITESYAVPIANDLELMSLQDYDSLSNSAEKIKNLILKHTVTLIRPLNNKKNSKKIFFRLPDDVKLARSHGRVIFDLWKNRTFLWRMRFMKSIVLHVKSTNRNCAVS